MMIFSLSQKKVRVASMNNISRDIPALTGLRFVAAFYVFLFHIHIRMPLTENTFLAGIIGQGAIGMTIFFVLSGFILTHRYSYRDYSDRSFIVSRIARIYPIYIASFLLAVPVLYFQLDDFRFGIFSAVIQVIVIFVTVVTMLQAWFPMLFSYVNNSASWSLSVEAFFYATFLLIEKRVVSLGRTELIGLGIILYVVSSGTAIPYYSFENRPTHGLQIFYAMPIFRLAEFVLGMVIYHLVKKTDLASKVNTSHICILLLIACIYLGTFGPNLPLFIGHNWIVIPLVSSLLVLLSCQKNSLFEKFLKSGPMVYLGKISYCFYCFQFHVLTVLVYVSKNQEIDPLTFFTISFFCLLTISSFFYHVLEEPARKFISRKYSSPCRQIEGATV